MRDELRYKLEVEIPVRAVLDQVAQDAQVLGGVTEEEFYRVLLIAGLEKLDRTTSNSWLMNELKRIQEEREETDNV